jgi:hypothetical protein
MDEDEVLFIKFCISIRDFSVHALSTLNARPLIS